VKVTQLTRRAGVTKATVQYYLRRGLLHPGTPVTATTSLYDDTHVARVRLIRALVEGAGMSIAQVEEVLTLVDAPPRTWAQLSGATQTLAADPRATRMGHTAAANRLVRSQGWKVSQSSPARKDLERALTHARAAGLPLDDEALDRYAETVREAAVVEVNQWSGTSPGQAAPEAAVGAILLDPVLTALRRLAQEDVTARTLAAPSPSAARKEASRSPRVTTAKVTTARKRS